MDREELTKLLRLEGFRENSYSFEEAHPDEALCLRHEQGQWCVFYAERGLQTGKVYFGSEEEACEYFLKEMRDDPTTRKDWKSGFSLHKVDNGQE